MSAVDRYKRIRLPVALQNLTREQSDALRKFHHSTYNAGRKSVALASDELMRMCLNQAATIKRYIEKFGEID